MEWIVCVESYFRILNMWLDKFESFIFLVEWQLFLFFRDRRKQIRIIKCKEKIKNMVNDSGAARSSSGGGRCLSPAGPWRRDQVGFHQQVSPVSPPSLLTLFGHLFSPPQTSPVQLFTANDTKQPAAQVAKPTFVCPRRWKETKTSAAFRFSSSTSIRLLTCTDFNGEMLLRRRSDTFVVVFFSRMMKEGDYNRLWINVWIFIS